MIRGDAERYRPETGTSTRPGLRRLTPSSDNAKTAALLTEGILPSCSNSPNLEVGREDDSPMGFGYRQSDLWPPTTSRARGGAQIAMRQVRQPPGHLPGLPELFAKRTDKKSA